jgi:CHAT domain-containing protein/lipopolysaccharide biosynthesis regulator YciM
MARPGPRNWISLSFVCLLFLFTVPSTVNPDSAFAHIRTEMQHGNFLQARGEARGCYAAWQSHPAAKWHWKFRLLDAEILLLNGDTRRAVALLAVAPPSQYQDLQPRFQMLQGYVAFREQRNSLARDLLLRAAEAAHRLSQFDLEADSNLLLAQYAPADAEKLINSVLETGRIHNLRYQTAAALVTLGYLRIQQARYAAAVPIFEQAARTANQVQAAHFYSISLGNLAYCYDNLGDFDKAVELRKQAIISQKTQGLTTLLRDSYRGLGESQWRQGDTHNAIRSLGEALNLASAEDTPRIYYQIACILASALETNGDLDAAESLIRSAIAANKDPEAVPSLHLVEAALAEDRGRHDLAVSIYRRALSAPIADPSVQWSANAALASIYADKNDGVSDLVARRLFESALTTIEANRAEQLENEYKITFLSTLIRFYREYVAFLMRKGDVTEALLVADSSRASVLTHVTGVDARANRGLLERIQKAALRNNTTYLFYFLAPGKSYLWIITGRELKTATLPGEEKLGSQIRAYRHLLEEATADPLRSSNTLPSQLFKSLVEPALRWIAPGSAVVIVPDGALHGLNFETLIVNTPTPHYWIEDVTLSIAPSLNILTSGEGDKNPADRSLLLIGDPTPTAEYSRLSSAGDEMDQVGSHFDKRETTELKGSDAFPDAYKASRPERFSTVHFASHAQANERSPLDSAIILSPTAAGFRLYAREIMRVPLTARLVTLSACRSAGARTLSGEGPVGFAWAFFQAGAENVVASLWDVNDRSTADLMKSFYTAVDIGQSYAGALRQAKLDILQFGYRKPYYWAAFQLYSRRFQ